MYRPRGNKSRFISDLRLFSFYLQMIDDSIIKTRTKKDRQIEFLIKKHVIGVPRECLTIIE